MRGRVYHALFGTLWPTTHPQRYVYEKIIVEAKAHGHLLPAFTKASDLRGSDSEKFDQLVEALAQGGYTLLHLAEHMRQAQLEPLAMDIVTATV